MANLSKAEPVAIIKKAPPTRTRIGADGEELVEKLSPNPYSAKMVTPSGNVISVPMTTGRSLHVDDPDNRYWFSKRREKLEAGFIFYGECPEGKCQNASDEAACEHVEAIIRQRSGRQEKHNHDFHEQFKTAPEKFYDAEMKRATAKREPKRGRSSE